MYCREDANFAARSHSTPNLGATDDTKTDRGFQIFPPNHVCQSPPIILLSAGISPALSDSGDLSVPTCALSSCRACAVYLETFAR